MNRTRYGSRQEDLIEYEDDGTQGRYSRLTAAQIAEIRAAYRALREAEERRRAVVKRHGISIKEFWRYGVGLLGKKPARVA